MVVRTVENREIVPAAAGAVDALDFARDPASLVFDIGEFDDANLFAFGPAGGEHLLRKIRAHGVHSDDLACDAQDIRRGPVVFREADPKRRGIVAFPPSGETLQKKFETAERCAKEAINGL